MAEKKKTVAKKIEAKAVTADKPKAKTAVKKRSAVKKEKSAIVGHGVGRRKSAVARVWLARGQGQIKVNGLDYQSYFDTEMMRLEAAEPFAVVKLSQKYDVSANIIGGGKIGQAGALKLGIARALLEHDPELRSELRKFDLLTVDSRVKERKKYGQPAARKKFQFVKR